MPEPSPSGAGGIAVVGVGAVGGTVAAALGDAGRRPVLASRTAVSKLVRTLNGEVVSYAFDAITAPAEAGHMEWVLLCTKAYQCADAARWFETLVSTHTTVAVLQNGVDQVERLSEYLPQEQIVPVVVQMACEREAPGRVLQTRPGVLYVPDTERAQRFAALFEGAAALEARVEKDFVSALWRKLAINAVTGAIGALTLRANGVLGEPRVREAAVDLMAEVIAVGQAEGARFPEAFVEETLDRLGGPVRDHWSSIAADRREGMELEWRVRNAVVGRLGRRHGIATPLNDLMTALLSAAA